MTKHEKVILWILASFSALGIGVCTLGSFLEPRETPHFIACATICGVGLGVAIAAIIEGRS